MFAFRKHMVGFLFITAEVFYTLIANSELVNAEGLLQGETWG